MERGELELLQAWGNATKQNPLVLTEKESDLFLSALRKANSSLCESSKVQIAPRFQEYKSQIDGSVISDRAQHREHLRSHGATEIGTAYDSDVRKLKEASMEGKERTVQFHEEVKSSSEGFSRALYQRINQ